MVFLGFFGFLIFFFQKHIFYIEKNHFNKPVFLPLYISTTCCFYLRVTAQFLEILGALHISLMKVMCPICSYVYYFFCTHNLLLQVFLFQRKQSPKVATCSFFMAQTPGTWKTDTRFCLMFRVFHLLYLCCYSLLRNSSSGCFSASDISVLWYFQLLVISKIPKYSPVQHLNIQVLLSWQILNCLSWSLLLPRVYFCIICSTFCWKPVAF